MGACCSNTNNNSNRRSSNLKSKEINKVEVIDNLDSSVRGDQIEELKKFQNQDPILEKYLSEGNTMKIKEMIDKKEIDLKKVDPHNGTILHQAVIRPQHPEVIRIILNSDPSILNSVQNNHGNPALFYAAANGDVEVVKALLEYNPDITLRNKDKKDIFEYLEENYQMRIKYRKGKIDEEEKKSFDTIILILREYENKNKNVEDLDGVTEMQNLNKKEFNTGTGNFRQDRM